MDVTKVKEEIPDKDYNQSTTADRRKTTTSGKGMRSPEHEESRTSPPPGPASPQNNGTAGCEWSKSIMYGSRAFKQAESLSPPLSEPRAPLHRLRKFLSALHHFAADCSVDAGERVRQLIFNLVAGTLSIEEFQIGVQESAQYPLRASVPGFLRALLPPAQRDLHARAKRNKQTPLQYVRSHEHVVLEGGGDGADIFNQDGAAKRRASDPFYDASTNGAAEDYGPLPKRVPPASLFTSQFPLPSNANLFDCPYPLPGYHNHEGNPFERRDGGITVRDVSQMNASLGDPRAGPGLLKTSGDDEWRNINTMLNCILSMVEKTKRALAILQQRGVEPPPENNTDMKRMASEIMAAAVRQTEERVAEVRRRAEDAVNQVKRQALLELQRAMGAAEAKALEIGGRHERRTPPPAPELSPNTAGQQNCCWNCGRKAQETCSGCNAARYCGAFCQHKDWENHHQVCSGRDQKPSSLLRTSPPASKTIPRATTPLPAPTSTVTQPSPIQSITQASDRLTMTLNSERLIPLTNERALNSNGERITLANLSAAQALIGGIGGKK